MRAPALALLALLGALAPATTAGEGLAGDLDASAAYLSDGAGAWLPLAGLPALGGAAPAAGASLGQAPLTEAQGRALRPDEAPRWASAAGAGLDAQQGLAAQDTQSFADAWAAWAGVAPPPAGAALQAARPGRQAGYALDGPRIHSLATSPAWDQLTNAHARLEVRAALDAPRGVHAAWATLRTGAQGVERDLARGPDGLWSASFDGPFPAGARLELVVEALDGSAAALEPSAFAQGAWPVGYSRTDPLPLLPADALPPSLRLSLPAYTRLDLVEALVEARDEVGVEALRHDTGSGYGPWAAPLPLLALPLAGDGPATLRAEARDRAGNLAAAEATVVRDTLPPEALLHVPPGDWQAGPAVVRAEAGPSLAPAWVQLSLDGSDPRAAPPLGRDRVALAAPGVHTMRAVARDAAGNTGPEQRAVVRVDLAAPELALRGPDLAPWLARAPRLALEARDALSGLALLEAHLVDDAGRRRAVDPAGFEAPEGSHRLVARALDRAGHAASLEQPLRIDLTPPLSHLAAAGEAGRHVLAWRAVDAGSGVAGVRVEARAPGQAWALLAEGPAEGSTALEVAAGEAREVRALAWDHAGHVEAKAAPDLVLRGPAAPGPATAEAAPGPAPPPEAPRLVAEPHPGGSLRVRIAGGEGLLRLALGTPGPWRAGELLLDAPGEHVVEAWVGAMVLRERFLVPGPGAAPAAPASPGKGPADEPPPRAPPGQAGPGSPLPPGPAAVKAVPAAAFPLALALAALLRRRRA